MDSGLARRMQFLIGCNLASSSDTQSILQTSGPFLLFQTAFQLPALAGHSQALDWSIAAFDFQLMQVKHAAMQGFKLCNTCEIISRHTCMTLSNEVIQ
jgi:hypothetical protein